jgi:hypothetical protein
LRRATAAGVGPDALVFVAGTPYSYSALFLANDFPLTAGRVFVRDVPPLREQVAQAYPRRETWLARVVLERVDPEAPEIFRAAEVSWTRLQ